MLQLQKWLFISVLAITMFFSFSCEKNKPCNVIPNVTVDFKANLDDSRLTALNVVGNAVEIPLNLSRYSKGYANSGVIVYRKSEDEFLAFDRTCTFGHSNPVAVNADTEETWIAVCPECQSVYRLASYGVPDDGSKSECPLKEYHADYFEGSRTVQVINY